jgi:hypothetical protein
MIPILSRTLTLTVDEIRELDNILGTRIETIKPYKGMAEELALAKSILEKVRA